MAIPCQAKPSARAGNHRDLMEAGPHRSLPAPCTITIRDMAALFHTPGSWTGETGRQADIWNNDHDNLLKLFDR